MKKSARFLTAILLVISMLIPGTVAFGYDAGETISWKVTEECDGDTSTCTYTPVYKGEAGLGETTYKYSDDADGISFLFTADKAGYYLFGTEDYLFVSDKITDGKPENYRNSFWGFDFTKLSSYTYREAYYFEAGEKEYLKISMLDTGAGSRSLTITYAGEISDIEFYDDETYYIGSNIWCYENEEGSGYEGGLRNAAKISFTGYDAVLDCSWFDFKCNEILKNGDNTITLCVGNFEKEITVNCFDLEQYITYFEKADNTLYVDYFGNYCKGNDSNYIVTLADGTTKEVAEDERFEVNGAEFYIISGYGSSTADGETHSYYDHYLYYCTDAESDSWTSIICSHQDATTKRYFNLKQFLECLKGFFTSLWYNIIRNF